MERERAIHLLRTNIDDWNRERELSSDRIDLTGVDLSGRDLTGANLTNLSLGGANLRRSILVEANLKRVNLKAANLHRTNLSRANLEIAELSDANLSRANLSAAKLESMTAIGANFDFARLVCAELMKTNLEGASFMSSNLSDSNLSNAWLFGTNFCGSNLSRSNLSGAVLGYTNLGLTRLPETVGLDTCIHKLPSIINHQTLQDSGSLPINFLQGCGLPDVLIDYLPSLLNQPISYYSCFISYSHEDKKFAQRLHDQLQGRGIRCWLDEHQVLPGDDIYEQVDRGIRLWDKVLLCCSQSSLTSWWVDSEIDKAFRKEQQLMKDRKEKVWALIPLNLDNHLFCGDWSRGMADQVKSRLAANFEGWESSNDVFEDAFEKLVKALQTEDSGREMPPASKI